ncbi:MAG: Gfo/Idh/MocA family oxidoreductase [Bacteroidales bacterium]|jgi:predicted dehydrogenase|nr:Gfo/Idh/MocA family oxidoreductase [Bacteroidales bacterium]
MKILIIGLGSIAKKHIAAIRSIESNASIYALRSQHNAQAYDGITNLYSFDEASNIGFDFAIISNPTSEHKHTIQKLLEFKIPLFIEKPVASSPIDDLINSIKESRILTYVACNLRFLEVMQFLKERVESGNTPGRINEVNVYCGSYLPEWRPGTDFRESYSAKPEMGGGVHLDLIHEFDYICWIFGVPERHKAFCRSKSSLAIDAIDYAKYLLFYEDFTCDITLNYFRRDYKREIEILFDTVTWKMDLAKNSITNSNGVVIFQSEQSVADTYTGQMRYFFDLVSNSEKDSFNDIIFANEILKLCLDYERP